MRIESQDFEINPLTGKLDLVVRDTLFPGFTPSTGSYIFLAGGVVIPYSYGSLGGAADRLVAIPIIIPRRCKIYGVYAFINTSASGNMKLALYDSNSDFYPSSLIAGSSNISTGANGSVSWLPSGGIAVDAGIYFVGAHWSAAPSMRSVPATAVVPFYGWASDLSTVTGRYWQTTSAFSSGLPDPFPSGATLIGGTTAVYALGVAVQNL